MYVLLLRSSYKDFILKIFLARNYNQFHKILRLFDVSPNFLFTTSETMCDYYLQT